MRIAIPACAFLLLAAVATGRAAGDRSSETADPGSDAPETRAVAQLPVVAPATYEEALRSWNGASEINAWVGAMFRYDVMRALELSETQRRNTRLPIHAHAGFYASPARVCVDLARFAVETLRVIDPSSSPRYLMIEFDPLTLAGNTLRRHWIASFERDSMRWFFADSKRPGHIAGPYSTTQAFIDDYAKYRGRRIVAFREVDTYQRQQRSLAARLLPEEAR